MENARRNFRGYETNDGDQEDAEDEGEEVVGTRRRQSSAPRRQTLSSSKTYGGMAQESLPPLPEEQDEVDLFSAGSRRSPRQRAAASSTGSGLGGRAADL